MLSKAICQRCNKHDGYDNWMYDYTLKEWARGVLFPCKTDWFHSSKSPPDCCPYSLEHLMKN